MSSLSVEILINTKLNKSEFEQKVSELASTFQEKLEKVTQDKNIFENAKARLVEMGATGTDVYKEIEEQIKKCDEVLNKYSDSVEQAGYKMKDGFASSLAQIGLAINGIRTLSGSVCKLIEPYKAVNYAMQETAQFVTNVTKDMDEARKVLQDFMDDSSGATDMAYEIMANSIKNKTDVFMTNLENIGLKIMGVVGDAGVRILDIANSVMPAVASTMTVLNSKLGESLISSFAPAFKFIGASMVGLINKTGILRLGFIQSVVVALGLTPALQAVGVAGLKAGTTTSIAFGPVTLIALAIAGLIGLFVILYKKVEPVKQVMDAVWEVIKSIGVAIFTLGKLIFTWITMPFRILHNIMMKIRDKILGAAGDTNFFGEAVKNVGDFFDYISVILDGLIDRFGWLADQIANLFTLDFSNLKEFDDWEAEKKLESINKELKLAQENAVTLKDIMSDYDDIDERIRLYNMSDDEKELTAQNEVTDAQVKQQDKASKLMSQSLQASVTAMVGSFAQLKKEGASTQKALLMSVFEGVKASVPVLLTEILAKYIAANPLTGALLFTGASALIYSMLGAASSAVSSANFFKGGYVQARNSREYGVDNISANLTHGEFVINDRAVKIGKNRAILEEVNRKNISIEEFYKNDLSTQTKYKIIEVDSKLSKMLVKEMKITNQKLTEVQTEIIKSNKELSGVNAHLVEIEASTYRLETADFHKNINIDTAVTLDENKIVKDIDFINKSSRRR